MQDVSVPQNKRMFMRLEGDKTESIELRGSNVTALKDRIQFGKDISPDIVTMTNMLSWEKKARIAKIIADYTGRIFSVDIRGPLTIEKVEKESLDGLSENTQKVPFGLNNKRWLEFKDKYQESDEIYFYVSDKTSWERLSGSQGYVLIRNDQVIAMIVTMTN